MITSQSTEAEDLARSLLTTPPPADPWPVYGRLRDIAPVAAVGDTFVVTGFEPVFQILRSGRIFAQGPAERNRTRSLPRFSRSKFLQATSAAVVMVDPPDHTRLRRVLTKLFTPSAISGIEPFVRRKVDELIDCAAAESAATGGVSDLKTGFAGRLPIAVIGHLIGFPEEDHERLARWGHLIEFASTPLVTDEQLAAADEAVYELEEYTNALYADRLACPRDDVVTALVQATEDDGMSREEFSIQVLAVVVAGTQTTAHLMTSAIVGLAEHPDQRERFLEDRSVDERAVEEFLRFYPPLQSCFPRLALESTELGGIAIEQWQMVVPFVAAANRDSAVFDRGDELLIDRDPTSPPQLAFGYGAHLCVGRALARLEGRIAIRRWFDRFPDLEVDLPGVEHWATAMARGHAHVPVRLGREREVGV